jgi:hypothetical protein
VVGLVGDIWFVGIWEIWDKEHLGHFNNGDGRHISSKTTGIYAHVADKSYNGFKGFVILDV